MAESKIPIGGNYFISSTNFKGLTRCHIRYHKMCYDQNNQVTYQPTKFGVSLTYGQLVNISKNINTIISEMEALNATKAISNGTGQWSIPTYCPESGVPQPVSMDCFYQDLLNSTATNVETTQPPQGTSMSFPTPTTTKKQTYRRKKLDGSEL